MAKQTCFDTLAQGFHEFLVNNGDFTEEEDKAREVAPELVTPAALGRDLAAGVPQDRRSARAAMRTRRIRIPQGRFRRNPEPKEANRKKGFKNDIISRRNERVCAARRTLDNALVCGSGRGRVGHILPRRGHILLAQYPVRVLCSRGCEQSSDLVVEFQGGGACFDALTCDTPSYTRRWTSARC